MIRRLAFALSALLPGSCLLRLERRLARPPFTGPTARRALLPALSWLRTGEVVIPRGVAAGLRFDPHGQIATVALGVHDPEAQQALASVLRPGMTFYDVGANIGFFTLVGARLVGPAGRVYALEPLGDLADAIERNAALNRMRNVTVLRCAAARRSGPLQFVLVDDAGVRTGSHLAGLQHPSPGRAIEVDGAALDDLVRRGRAPAPDVVKLDVEGAEGDVLAGMEGIVRERRPAIVAELHGDQSEFVARLRELGYAVTPLGRPDGPVLTQYPQILALPA